MEFLRGVTKEVSGRLKQLWGALLGDDALQLEGAKEVFLGKVQQRSAPARQELDLQLHALIARIDQQKRSGSGSGSAPRAWDPRSPARARTRTS